MQKLTPIIENFGKNALDQLSTKIRPQENYKTNSRDVDGFTGAAYATGGGATGGAFDIHKAIGKLPKPKGGWTLPGHKYIGPYNDLDSQVRFDPETGEILEIYDQPTGTTDAITM